MYKARPSNRLIEQLPTRFKEYMKNLSPELEKGQFDKILNMDLAQDMKIFIHVLPSIPVFNDGGIKRVWNFILGVSDDVLSNEEFNTLSLKFIEFCEIQSLNNNHIRREILARKKQKIANKKKQRRRKNRDEEIVVEEISSNVEEIIVDGNENIELEILQIWPYAIGGYLRAITPENSIYTYPPMIDAVKYGKRRSILLLDVIEKIYNNNMRQIALQQLQNSDRDAKLITLASTVKYLTYYLKIEHSFFQCLVGDGYGDCYGKQLSINEELFIRLSAFMSCFNVDDDIVSDDEKACVLSTILYNVIDGLVRDDFNALVFLSFLHEYEILSWSAIENTDKVGVGVEKGKGKKYLKVNFEVKYTLIVDEFQWREWKDLFFNFDSVESQRNLEKLKEKIFDEENVELYAEMVKYVPKYSVLRRPGEDTFQMKL